MCNSEHTRVENRVGLICPASSPAASHPPTRLPASLFQIPIRLRRRRIARQSVKIATGDEHENLVRERCQPLLCRSGDQVPSAGIAASGSPPGRVTSSSPIAGRTAARPSAASQWSISGRFRPASKRANGSRLPDRAPRNTALGAIMAPTASMTAGVRCRCAVLNCRPPCRSARKE